MGAIANRPNVSVNTYQTLPNCDIDKSSSAHRSSQYNDQCLSRVISIVKLTMFLKFAIVSLFFATAFQNACGNVNISCSTISTDIFNVIQTESNEQLQGVNQKTYTYNGNTYYYYYWYYDDDEDDDSNAAISFPIANKFVMFLVHKILTRPNQWKKFDGFFNEGIVQNLNIRYRLNFPCKDKSKNNKTVVVEWSRNNALNGILKGLEAINHKFEVIVDINFKDGFNEICDNDLCDYSYSQDELNPLFCQVTNMVCYAIILQTLLPLIFIFYSFIWNGVLAMICMMNFTTIILMTQPSARLAQVMSKYCSLYFSK